MARSWCGEVNLIQWEANQSCCSFNVNLVERYWNEAIQEFVEQGGEIVKIKMKILRL
jgi:hypothetical protein